GQRLHRDRAAPGHGTGLAEGAHGDPVGKTADAGGSVVFRRRRQGRRRRCAAADGIGRADGTGRKAVGATAAVGVAGNGGEPRPARLKDPVGQSAFTAAATISTVKPKCANKVSAGADAPKPSMPITAPSSPTYLRQKSLTPASIATRL